jgi:hypothetical protein
MRKEHMFYHCGKRHIWHGCGPGQRRPTPGLVYPSSILGAGSRRPDEPTSQLLIGRVSWSIPPPPRNCHSERSEESRPSAAPKFIPGPATNNPNAHRNQIKVRAGPARARSCAIAWDLRGYPQNRLTYATRQSSIYMIRVCRIRDFTDSRNVFPDRECVHGPDGPVAQAAGTSRNRTAGRNGRQAPR